jgi:20S proteasome alpha/beta subunit
VHAAHSRRRLVSRPSPGTRPTYDRSITTFDPSGRLLQVEYGMQAAQRGSSFLVALVENDEYAVLITESSKTDATTSYKVHRITSGVFMVTTGLSGDARALASAVRSNSLQHQLTYGELPTVKQVARHVASLQHALTKAGGARPLGCTAAIVGIDPVEGRMKLYQTDPGGILEECICSVGGKSQSLTLDSLRRRSDDVWKESPEGSDDTVDKSRLIGSVSALLQAFSFADNKAADDKTFDVWVMRPSSTRRGGIHMTCFREAQLSHPESVLDAMASHLQLV